MTFTESNPSDDEVSPDADDVVMAKFTAVCSGAAVTLTSFTVDAGSSDSGDSDTDVASGGVQLFRDNGDGSFNSGTDVPVDSGTFSGDTVTLTVAQAFTPGTTITYFLVYQLADQGSNGETLSATLTASISGGTAVYPSADTKIDSRTITMQIGASGGSVGSGGGGCSVGSGVTGSPLVWLIALVMLAIVRRRVA